jgi:hypothetical protein
MRKLTKEEYLHRMCVPNKPDSKITEIIELKKPTLTEWLEKQAIVERNMNMGLSMYEAPDVCYTELLKKIKSGEFRGL